MKSLSIITLILAFFISCKQQETTTTAATNSPNLGSACSVGQWPSGSLPLNLKISSEFASDYNASQLVGGLNPIEQMAKAWNDAIPSKQFFIVPFATAAQTGFTNLNDYRDSEMGIYKSHTWYSNVSSSALAITQYYGLVRSSAGLGTYIELTHADIIVNFRDYNSSFTYNTIDFIDYDVPTVILHEMGHFLGMCHDNSGHTSIMRPYYLAPQRSLFVFDKTKITDLYVNNLNTLGSSGNGSAITIPEGSVVRGTVELMSNGMCKHYLNGKLVFEHDANKKGLVKNKAFTKIFAKFNKLF